MDRNETIRDIRASLRKRSGKPWSVRGGRGTAWGWIEINSPPKRAADQYGRMTEAERAELAELLGLRGVGVQGVNIPDSNDYYREYLDRAAGRVPAVHGTPYWD